MSLSWAEKTLIQKKVGRAEKGERKTGSTFPFFFFLFFFPLAAAIRDGGRLVPSKKGDRPETRFSFRQVVWTRRVSGAVLWRKVSKKMAAGAWRNCPSWKVRWVPGGRSLNSSMERSGHGAGAVFVTE